MGIGQPSVRHPIGAKGINLRHPDLHRIEAENIGRQRIQTALLPGQYIGPCCAIEPGAERYNDFF